MTGPRRDPDMIRPYVRTRGQGRTRPDVRLETVVIAAAAPLTGVGIDARRVMALFSGGRGGLAVAEIAAALDLPPITARILVSSLVDSGHLTSPVAVAAHQPDAFLMRRVLNGLRKAL
ncbi:DUF742 domain-containing protein [Streptomyces sp. NPDC001508]|uniref:DUF742 domain-containing protein n=1 Tax=Streptomyces sp. NPDC001508 TaxID=3154656 RepID=UPI003317254E